MLFSPVYTEAHPRRMAAHAASCFSSNSFASYSLRTLASHFQTSVSSNLFEINRFRTLCKIPGIGYPPPSLFLDRHSTRSPRFPAVDPFSLQSLTKCPSSNSFVLTTIHFHGGCTPPLKRNTLRQEPPLLTLCASVAIPPMMYPVPGFSAGSHLPARKLHTGIHRREAQ
jgi:hypothetical protein